MLLFLLLFFAVRAVEFINHWISDWRWKSLKQTNEREILFPVICCLVHLILDYSNFQSSLSWTPVSCLLREISALRYLADEIRCESSGMSRKAKRKTNFKTKNHSAQSRDTNISLNYLIPLKTVSFGLDRWSEWRSGRASGNRHDRKQFKDWATSPSIRMKFYLI